MFKFFDFLVNIIKSLVDYFWGVVDLVAMLFELASGLIVNFFKLIASFPDFVYAVFYAVLLIVVIRFLINR